MRKKALRNAPAEGSPGNWRIAAAGKDTSTDNYQYYRTA